MSVCQFIVFINVYRLFFVSFVVSFCTFIVFINIHEKLTILFIIEKKTGHKPLLSLETDKLREKLTETDKKLTNLKFVNVVFIAFFL